MAKKDKQQKPAEPEVVEQEVTEEVSANAELEQLQAELQTAQETAKP